MIIGIGGISNAGKSKLAKMIAAASPNKKVYLICQDDYAFQTKDIPLIRDHTDWEVPESLDFERIHNDLIANIPENDIVIVEGIFAFNYAKTNDLYHKRIYLTLEKDEFLKRKNTDLRWGKEPEWYMHHIWENHLKYTIAKNLSNVMIIDATNEIDIKKIIDFINS